MYKVWFGITPHHWLVDRENHRRWCLGNLGQKHSVAKFWLIKNSISMAKKDRCYSYISYLQTDVWHYNKLQYAENCSTNKFRRSQRSGCKRSSTQSAYIPRVPQCLSPRPNWDPPPPSDASERGGTLACGWGGGGASILTTGEKAKHSVYSVVQPYTMSGEKFPAAKCRAAKWPERKIFAALNV